MSDLCDQLDSLAVSAPDSTALQDLIDTIVNDELMDPFSYAKVTIKPDDPANPKCTSNIEACWNDENQTLYYNQERLSQLEDAKRFVETFVHEALHAMDYQDYGDSSKDLGDEITENYTVQLYNEYGEDAEKLYSPGEIIPGDEHMEEVYEPASEIADLITEFCREIRKADPKSRESIKNELREQIEEILDDRWEPDDDPETSDSDERRRRKFEGDLNL